MGGNPVVVPGDAENALGGYSGFSANGQDPNGVFKPWELPILYGPAYGPAGQYGTHDDCQGGQNGYPLGQLLQDGQPGSMPAIVASDLPGSRGPTTAFWDDDGNRVLFDSRVASRAPESWPQFGGSQ